MSEIAQPQEYDEHPILEYLDFTFSTFGPPVVNCTEGKISVPAKDFKVAPGFPGYQYDVIVLKGEVVFEKVVSSVRVIQEIDKQATATEGKTIYMLPSQIDDGPFPKVDEEPFSIYLGGFTFDPDGWIEWDINAVEIRVIEYESKHAT